MNRSRQLSEWRAVRIKPSSSERRSVASSLNLREVFRTERRRKMTSNEIISPWADNSCSINAHKIDIYTPIRRESEDRDLRFEYARDVRARPSFGVSRGLLIKLFILLNLMMLGLIIGALLLR